MVGRCTGGWIVWNLGCVVIGVFVGIVRNFDYAHVLGCWRSLRMKMDSFCCGRVEWVGELRIVLWTAGFASTHANLIMGIRANYVE